LTFAEEDLHQLPVDAALDGNGIERRNRSQPVEIDPDVAGLARHRDHRHAAGGGVLSLLATAGLRLARFGEQDVGDRRQDTDRSRADTSASASEDPVFRLSPQSGSFNPGLSIGFLREPVHESGRGCAIALFHQPTDRQGGSARILKHTVAGQALH
jgi:hypothetical protein